MSEARHLIDYLVAEIRCNYPSELHSLSTKSKRQLVAVLQATNPSDYPLKQWNDALDYIAHAPAQKTAEAACAVMIAALLDAATNQ